MKKTTTRLAIFFLAFLLFTACKKELSLEGSGRAGAAQGSLTDSSGNCRNIDIRGTYIVDSAVSDSNYLLVKVDFSARGKYKILSDTANGLWFADSGYALQTGAAVIKVKAYGKPILGKQTDFLLSFNSSYCSFSVNVVANGVNTDYFPNTFGSKWTYDYIPPVSTTNNQFNVTVLPVTYTVDGKTYFEFRQSDLAGDTSSYYFAKDGAGLHYALSTVEYDYATVFDSIVPFTFFSYVFLDENAALNATWESGEQPGTCWLKGVSGKAKAVFTIVQKGGAYTAGGKTYPDVIAVKREIYFKSGNATSFTKLGSGGEGTAYYARGVGMVDQVFPATGGTQAITLRSSTIK